MAEQQFTQGHALIVGVGFDLPNTVQDALGLAEILQDEERCAYPTTQVTVLTEEKAARQQILDKLDELASTVGPDDTVIFYFSGHGYEVNIDTVNLKEYYLMPYGYNHTDLSTTISRPELMEKLNAIKAKKQLILFDCCHASGLDDLDAQAKSVGMTMAKALPQSTIDELAKGEGRVIISSCKARELSYSGVPYSQFTQALVEGLAGDGASRQDGYVRAADLATYAAKTVPLNTQDRQNPALNFAGADNFAIAYYAAGETVPKGLPKSAQRQSAPELSETPTGAVVGNNNVTGNDNVVGNDNTVGDNNVVGDGNIVGNNNLVGDGNTVGNNNVVAGDRGVAVGGNVDGNIVTGDNNRVVNAETYNEGGQHTVFNQEGQTIHGDQNNVAGDVGQIGDRHEQNINTGGGAFIDGNASPSGDFIGRDKIVQGDEVHGDKFTGDKVAGDKFTGDKVMGNKNEGDKVDGDKISVGNISGGTGIAIGRNASANVTQGVNAQELSALAQLFQPIYPKIEQSAYPQAIQTVIKQQVQTVEEETKNGEQADAQKVEGALTVIGSMAPDILQVVAAALMSPIQGISVALKKVAERMRS